MYFENLSRKEHVARSDKGLAFEKFHSDLLKTLANPDAEVADDVEAMNQSLRELAVRANRHSIKITPELIAKELTVGDVQTTPVLQQFAQAYANDEFIGTRIMPVVPVSAGTGSAIYWTLDETNAFSEPDDSISTSGTVNEISESLTETSTTLVPRALQESIDGRVQAAMDAPVAALIDPLMSVMDTLLLKQERRIATVATTSTNYGSNTAAIAAASRWNSTGGGDPAGAIDTAKAALVSSQGPQMTVGFCSLAVYNVLRRHPAILDQFKYTNSDVVSRRMLADYFELDELLVGAGRYNSAMLGATLTKARIWSNVFGVVKVPRIPSVRTGGFGITLAEPFAEQEFFDPRRGGWGAMTTKVAFADRTVVTSTSSGYLLTTVID